MPGLVPCHFLLGIIENRSSAGQPLNPGRLLKTSLISPAQPWRAETRLFPFIVQTVNVAESFSEVGSNGGVYPFAKIHF